MSSWYIADDILVVGCGDTDEEANHDGKLMALHLGKKKLQFRVAEVRFDGHILSAAGLKPDLEKVRAIINITIP